MLTIEAPTAEQSYSPYHMLGSGLAMCTFGVMQSWGANAGFGADDLVIDVAWTFRDQPHRVGTITLTFAWPSLPAARLPTARRVAALCPIHTTFEHPPTVTIDGRV
jgi:uncharacterized OsmC-like protein